VTTIGTPVRRREDYRFLTGGGTYTDDIDRPGQLYAYILRSPHAHAQITAIDTAAAQRAPGVVAVYTGKDMVADGVGGLPCGWQVHSKDGSPMAEPPHPVLAIDRVRYVGDQVAVVIAESLAQARDAAELVNVDYVEESAAVEAVAALQPGAPQVNSEAPGNLCYDWQLGDLPTVEAAFARATRIVKLDLTNNRLVPNAMEPRSVIGEFNRATGEYTLYTTSQNPHVIRLLMGAFVLHIPEARLRVVAPDVGGGFGSKIYHYAEEAIVTWAAGKVHLPVKWTAERSESFMSDAHGRDHATHVELALDGQAKFLALKVSTVANMGPCSPAPIPPRRSTARPRRSSPTPRRSTLIAAPGAPKRRLCSSGSSISLLTRSAWIRPSCVAATSFRRTPTRTRHRWRCNMTVAITTRHWSWR